MSNPSLTSFFARRNRDRSESNQSLTSNVNAENASATRVPIESETPKVESSPVVAVADTASTNQTGSTVSFSANAFDIAFDNQTVATATPPTFADVVKNEKWSLSTIK